MVDKNSLVFEIPSCICLLPAHLMCTNLSILGNYIIREGTKGDTFYIISDGDVRVTKKSAGKEEEIRTLTRGDYFGEQVIYF